MSLRWRFETQAPYARLLAVVSEDGDGFSATVEGKIVASPRTEIPALGTGKSQTSTMVLNQCVHIRWKHCATPSRKYRK